VDTEKPEAVQQTGFSVNLMKIYCNICKIEISNKKFHKKICIYKQFNQTKMKTQTIKQNLELVPLKKSISIIEDKANALTIKTEEQIKIASDILFQISEFQKRVEEKKDKFVAPANAIIKEARLSFNPIIKQCEAAESTIKAKMVKFDELKQAAALKKLSAIADKVSSGKMDLETASEHIDNVKPQNSYSGDVGAISFREHKTVIITNESLIPRKYLVPDMVAIRAAVLAGEVILGTKIEITKIVTKSNA
jgi:hypothetical protein